MTLTFGIATRARLGTVARRPTGAIGATQETSTTTWATTPRAGTPRGSAVPEAGFGDGPEADLSRAAGRGGVGTAVRPDHGHAPRGRHDGSHARAAGPAADLTESTQLNWDNEATGSLLTPGLPARGRRGSHGGGPGGPGGTGPGGPGGPRRPLGPRGLAGPGRRGLDRPRVKVKGSWWRRWTLRKAVGVLLGVVGGIVVLGAVAVAIAYEETPVPTAALAATGFSQSVVYSKDGSLIGRFGTTNRKMLQYNEIPSDMINAVVAAEDRNFFNEGGISPTGIARAAYEDLTGNDGSLQGGSTITQEFVRQYYSGIGTQQTFSRKIKEIFVAMKVAKEKSKQWILTNYLNTIYLGQGAYGIEAAAETYYGKPSAKLTVAQDAVIAAIIQQPSTYPLRQYRTQLEARWHYVLNGMVQMGTLTEQKAAAMKFPAPGNHVPQTLGRDVWDPYVLNMVQTELEDTYHLSQEQIYNGGYVIRTTVDDKKMAALYDAVRENEALINASSHPLALSYMHAAAVLEDPDSGAIQAVYAGPGYIGKKYNGTGKVITSKLCAKIKCEWNMAVQNREQVGSSFKPYVLSAAVKAGMNVQTSTLNGFNNLYIAPDDQPNEYSTTTQIAGSHQVHNDSLSENGPYTPQIAMAVSINTAYADLWHRVGGTAVANIAQEFGVNTKAACITASCPVHRRDGARDRRRARPGVADGAGAGHHAGDDRQRRHLPQRPHRRLDRPQHPEQRPADPDQDHQLPGVQPRSHGEQEPGLAGAVRDVEGRRALRHRAGRRHEQRPGDHRQDRYHGQRPVGVLHRRHPEPDPGRRAVHQRAGQQGRQADPGPARRAFPGRHGRYLAGLDLAHLRREHVRPARDRAVPHPGLHRPDLEPGAAEPA